MTERSEHLSPPRGSGGVNVLGYHHVDSGLGVAARSITASLRAAGVEVTAVEVGATTSPRRPTEEGRNTGQLHALTIAVVTAAELPAVLESMPDLTAATRRLVGYWFWELASVPETHRRAIELVDAIWAPTEFVAEAYRRAGGAPVDVQPIYIPAPRPSDRQLADFGVKTAMTTYLVTYDYFSVAERKNPVGAISAFRQAFPGSDIDAALVVKTLNAEQREDAHMRVLDAAADDRRITVIDEQLDDADQAALLGGVQGLVALHRGEGLGLPIAEAMWLGTPVIASRYGGSMDLLDDSTAALVDVRLVPVHHGEGAYPDGALWAEPDLAQAADWMRRLAIEPYTRAQFADRARTRIAAQPAPQAVGARMGRAISALPAKQAAPTTVEPPATGLRRVARLVTGPARGYINRHFELTKEEIRLQVHLLAEHQAAQLAHAGSSGQQIEQQQITDLANVISEIGVHHTRVLTALRAEIAGLEQQLTELRDDLNTLTTAVVRLAEQSADGEE